MADTPLKNQIIAWLKSHNYWFQYSGNQILEGLELTDTEIDKTYQFFKEDMDLLPLSDAARAVVGYVEIEELASGIIKPLLLQTIKNIEHVNALAPNQSIPISPNLTIVYGANGSGKSGYIRLLNNSFNSRGDKQILHDVFDVKKGEPGCTFTFQSDSTPYDLVYPTQKANFEFSQYSVFDTHSIKVHLEGDNKLNFTPSGFEFFEEALSIYETLKAKLTAEINSLRPPNPYIHFFVYDNPIKVLIEALGSDTDIEELKKHGTYTDGDADRLAFLIAKREELKTLDIPKKIAAWQLLQSQLAEVVERLNAAFDLLKQSSIERIKNLISDYIKFLELSKQEGISSLTSYQIEQVGSEEWREFIKAAKDYASIIVPEEVEFPKEGDRCVFCLQPLQANELKLIKAYWDFLKSEAEGKVNRILQEIRELEKQLKGLFPVKFDDSTKLYEYINLVDPAFCVKWKEIVLSLEMTKQNAIQNLQNRNSDLPMQPCDYLVADFSVFAAKIEKEIKELFEKNPQKELEDLEKEIQYLTDKNLLNKLLEQVIVTVNGYKWAEKAERALSAFNTKSITLKQGELFSLHITEKYTKVFNEECHKLNAPKVVEINQKNSKGSTLRKLQIEGISANNILSEGEQRAVSLADFLTEVQLDPSNKGVFFDDPVTSQDHYRREKIAERLIELSKEKQVIIFTHDIAFFIRLKINAEAQKIESKINTMRNTGKLPGVISEDLPWIAQPIKGRIGVLKDRMVKLKKVEGAGDPDEYLFALKSWYGLLREAWERAVEERLFKGVVERFNLGIQTMRLKNVVITKDLLDEIEKGMTDSSSWIHDSAAGLNPAIPDTNKAEADLKLFESFAAKCVA